MEQDIIRSNRMNEAAKYGLILGLISSAYLYFGHFQYMIGLTGVAGTVLGFIIWAAKFVGCIKIMKYVMIKFATAHTQATNSDIFKLGFQMAVCSGLLFSVVTVADQLYIYPEYYQSIYEMAVQEYSKILPAEQVKEIKELLVYAPKISFFGTFLYCTIYGTVLSFILSRNIPSKNPFSNYKPDVQ